MHELESPDVTVEEPRRRTAATRFAALSDRLARTLPTAVRAEPSEPAGELPPANGSELADYYDVIPRFPLARSGYECGAVDEHIAGLERELAELEQELDALRARTPTHDQVAAEIQRLGEQTSSILLAAHDRAQETTRDAQAKADRCIADAAAHALAITEDANRTKREIDDQARTLSVQRARLLEDMQALAGTITSVAKDASARFTPPPPPPPGSRADQPTAALSGLPPA